MFVAHHVSVSYYTVVLCMYDTFYYYFFIETIIYMYIEYYTYQPLGDRQNSKAKVCFR